jgi:hypothetical protein
MSAHVVHRGASVDEVLAAPREQRPLHAHPLAPVQGGTPDQPGRSLNGRPEVRWSTAVQHRPLFYGPPENGECYPADALSVIDTVKGRPASGG